MPSEKRRYLDKNRPPLPLEDWHELRRRLASTDAPHLADMIVCRAQADSVLNKIVMLVAVFQDQSLQWDQAKQAIDYALHYPDYVRYHDYGHGQVLDEVRRAIEGLSSKGEDALAVLVGQYAMRLGEAVAEQFEDDWDWSSSLEELSSTCARLASTHTSSER